ncbi:GNAT family N-acetyltransferase [Pontixanthobacter gangjinensis]|uniref:GNAT family N-acetyltransferase n=1 Tax=Christiangramia aestuarii TaxID=1028746 RepID=A0A7K1LPR6_9FLAO|nr:GNAT family N-acetyltransferase [Christiangramia aestuarii]MUP42792.1 GNAT family N-acetyltransferase [Christiangramia aestuarii]
MYELKRTNSEDPDFIDLVKELDRYLAVCDGDEHDFYDQFNKLDTIKKVVVLYENDKPVGCGAIKEYRKNIAEVKRMYVLPDHRNKGYASKILEQLEEWALESGYDKCILETGLRQTEAIDFYYKNNYRLIPNYAPYEGMENSRCFEKNLKA